MFPVEFENYNVKTETSLTFCLKGTVGGIQKTVSGMQKRLAAYKKTVGGIQKTVRGKQIKRWAAHKKRLAA